MTNKMWKNVDILPMHDGAQWAVLRRGLVLPFDELAGVKVALRNWHPMHDPTLVAAPGSVRFAPPVCFDDLHDILMKSLRRNTIATIFFWAVFGCLALGAFLIRPSLPSIGLVLLGAGAVAMLGCDYVFYIRHREWLMERALFFYWLRSSRSTKVGLVFWLCFVLTSGGVQLFLQNKVGGIGPLVTKYGILYSAVREGELWRLVVGSIFHSSIAHFVNNFALLCLVGPITWAVLGPRSFLIFLLGATVGAATQTIWPVGGVDGYLGMSGGIYALAGLLMASGTLDRRYLPRGLELYLAWLTGISLLFAEFSSPNVATVAHCSGLFVGVAFAVLWQNESNEPGSRIGRPSIKRARLELNRRKAP